MTDGQQTVQEEGVISSDILSAAVQPLKEKNVRVISLGIGSNTNLFDLLTIASSDNDVFLAENFETLKGLVSDLAQNKCPGRDLLPRFLLCEPQWPKIINFERNIFGSSWTIFGG